MCIGREIEIEIPKDDNNNQILTRHDVREAARKKFLDQHPNESYEKVNDFADGCLALFDEYCEKVANLPEDDQTVSKEAFFRGLMDSNI